MSETIPPQSGDRSGRSLLDRAVVLLAEGLGAGRFPFAPGTIGTLPGLAWTAVLLWGGSGWFFHLGMIGAWIGAVGICARAERVLGQSDPGSVVLDEVVAVPLCFVGLAWYQHSVEGSFPNLDRFLDYWPWWVWPVAFAAFRVFDIWKPGAVGKAQKLPGGWGVVMDDLLAGGCVGLISGLVLILLHALP